MHFPTTLNVILSIVLLKKIKPFVPHFQAILFNLTKVNLAKTLSTAWIHRVYISAIRPSQLALWTTNRTSPSLRSTTIPRITLRSIILTKIIIRTAIRIPSLWSRPMPKFRHNMRRFPKARQLQMSWRLIRGTSATKSAPLTAKTMKRCITMGETYTQ